MSLRSILHMLGLLAAIVALSAGLVAPGSPVSADGANPPVAVADDASARTGPCVDVDVLANDTDADGDALTITGTDDGAVGSVAGISGGVITYCLSLGSGHTGTATFTYDVTDGFTTATGIVTVANGAPVVGDDDAGSVHPGQCVDLDVLANDTDPDGDALSISSSADGSLGSVSAISGGVITYCARDVPGTDSFTYEVSDGFVTSTATAFVEVINQAPIASDDAAMAGDGACVAVDVLANDSDPDGDALTLIDWTDGGNGYVDGSSGGTIEYCLSPGFTGDETFTYRVHDGHETDAATVTISAANTPPVAVDDSAKLNVDETTSIFPLDNDSDADGEPLTLIAIGTPDFGSVIVFEGGRIQYTAAPGFFGNDTFTYDITDGTDIDRATVTVRVSRRPVAGVESATTHANTAVSVSVLANDTDPDGDALHAEGPYVVSNGTAVNNGDGTITFTPTLNFVGTASFYYLPCDDVGCGDGSTVLISVTNTVPVAVNDSATTPRDAPVTIPVHTNDFDADLDPLTTISTTSPDHGAATISRGSIVYTPTAGYIGPDSFTYTITDGIAATCGTCTATVSITVTPRPPVVTTPASQTALEGTAKSFALGSFTDPDGTGPWSVGVAWGDGSALETFSIDAVGSLGTRSHTFGADSTRTVTVTVTDGDGGVSAPQTFTVAVANVAPLLRPGTAQSANAGSAKSFYLGFLTDPGTDDATWTVTVEWGDGFNSAFSGAGTVVGSAHAFYATHTYATGGAKTVSVQATDLDGASSATRTFVATVNAAPGLTPPASQTAFEGASKSFPLGSFTDPNGNGPWTVAVNWGDGTAAESFSVAAVGSLGSRTHAFGADASRTVTVTVTDAAGAVGTQSFTLTVANVAPLLRPGTAQTSNEGTAKSFYLGFITDPGTDDTTWTVTVDWGDGFNSVFSGAGTVVGSAHAFYASHAYGADGSYTPTVRVVDGDGGRSAIQPFTVTVANVAPLLRPGTSQTGSAGRNKSFFVGYLTDPGTDDTTWTLTINWGDGFTQTVTGIGTVVGSSHAYYVSREYGFGGTKTVSVTASDPDGGVSATRTFSITINAAPVITAPGNQTAVEGTSKSFDLGSFTDTDGAGPWTVTVSWGDGTSNDDESFSVTTASALAPRLRTYVANGDRTVGLTVMDAGGARG